MGDEIDWSLTTFEGLRRRQHQEFAALSFAEKLERVEQMNEIVEMFKAARTSVTGEENKFAPRATG